MTKAIALPNAMAVVTGAGYVICRLLASIAPSFLFSIAQSWFHTFKIEPELTIENSAGTFLIGLVSSMAVAWLWTWA